MKPDPAARHRLELERLLRLRDNTPEPIPHLDETIAFHREQIFRVDRGDLDLFFRTWETRETGEDTDDTVSA